MKVRMVLTVCLIAAAGMLAGCAKARKVQVWNHPEVGSRTDIVYSIGPFEDANARQDREEFPEAATLVKGAFETAFLQAGYRMVSDGKEDAIVAGTVNVFYRGKFCEVELQPRPRRAG